MLKYIALFAAVLTLPLALWGIFTNPYPLSATPRELASVVLIAALCFAQIPALLLRRWGLSLAVLAMAVALIVIDRMWLNPPPDCSEGCTYILESVPLKNS
ncbi:MAG: hypothetical protein ACAH11_09820 [Sphingomonas sp.]